MDIVKVGEWKNNVPLTVISDTKATFPLPKIPSSSITGAPYKDFMSKIEVGNSMMNTYSDNDIAFHYFNPPIITDINPKTITTS